MKIDHIEVINLRFEYAPEQAFQYAGGTCTARFTTLVLVHTDQGQTGIGSVYSHPGLVYLVIKQQLEPMLRGQDPADVESVWKKMYGLTRWYGRKGAAMSAIGGVDMALWDLRGKAQGKPIWKLLGGERPTCPAYASSLLWKPPEKLAVEAAGHIEKGFRRVKMRLGRSEEYDVAAVTAVRNAIGPTNDVLVDGSMRYSVEVARRIGKVLESQRAFWFEEPFAPEDLESFQALRGTLNVPLAAGENEFGTQGFRELIRMKAVDIVQPDACRCGGITELWRVAQEAHQAGLRVATHTWSDAVTVMANAQVVSAIPNGITVEIDRTGNPFIEDLLEEPLQVTDGLLALSNAPGLGIALKKSVIEKYRMADPLAIPDGSYSDMVFGPQYYTPAGPYGEQV